MSSSVGQVRPSELARAGLTFGFVVAPGIAALTSVVTPGSLSLKAVLQQREHLFEALMAWLGIGQGGLHPLVASREALVQTGLVLTEFIGSDE